MKHVLGVSRTEKLSEDTIPRHHHRLDLQVDLSQEEYTQYLQARDTLQGFLSDAQLFAVVRWNYQDFCDVLKSYLEAYLRRDSEYLSTRPMAMNINRAALNLLSAVRTYLDHLETRLKRKYGGTSELVRSFKGACKSAYDDNFGYRFLYGLRNYAQHCGFPITDITVSIRPIDGDLKRPGYSLSVRVSKEALMEGFNWKQLTAEIDKQPEMIDFNAHIVTTMRCLQEINSNVTKAEFGTLHESAAYIDQLLKRIDRTNGSPVIFQVEMTEDDVGKPTSFTNLSIQRIPVEIVEAVMNGTLEDITQVVTLQTP